MVSRKTHQKCQAYMTETFFAPWRVFVCVTWSGSWKLTSWFVTVYLSLFEHHLLYLLTVLVQLPHFVYKMLWATKEALKSFFVQLLWRHSLMVPYKEHLYYSLVITGYYNERYIFLSCWVIRTNGCFKLNRTVIIEWAVNQEDCIFAIFSTVVYSIANLPWAMWE